MLVSISGLIGSGKDTVADYLVKERGFVKESFASTVKDILSIVFQWDRNDLEGSTKASREWRTKVDPWWAKKLGIPEFTPRWAMQNIGTDVWRKHFHNDIWVFALQYKLERMSAANIVISDARYPNELTMLKDEGATLVCVERGDKPDWYDWAHRYNMMTDEHNKISMRIIGSLRESAPNPINRNIHTSEWAWIGTQFDLVLDNDGSVDELYALVRQQLSLTV